MSVPDHRLRTFCGDLLRHEGAIIEPIDPYGLEVMLPESARERLGVADDYLRLGFAAEIPDDAERVSLESEWLARFTQLLGQRGRVARFWASADSPVQPKFERMLEHRVVLGNAVYRLRDVRPAWTCYNVWVVRYTAVSDEKREGLLTIACNMHNGSALETDATDALLQGLLSNADNIRPEPAPGDQAADDQTNGDQAAGDQNERQASEVLAELPPHWSEAQLRRWLARSLQGRIRAALAPFVQSMQRRLERDLARIHTYYSGIREESQKRKRKAAGDSARDELRIAAAEREYRGKVADLEQKYALQVTTHLTQALGFMTPVWRVELLLKRRKRERILRLDWNPLTARLDPLPCDWDFTDSALRMVCDDALHLVPEHGLAPCPQCERAYCRACRPRGCARCAARSRAVQ